MKKPLLLLALASSSLASAETWVIPHILEKEGSIVGRVFNPRVHTQTIDDMNGIVRREIAFIPSTSVPLLQTLLPRFEGDIRTGKEMAIFKQEFGPAQANKKRMFEPMLTSFTLPACDATSKDPAYMVLKFSSMGESLEHVDAVPAPPRQKDRPFLMSAYQLAINGQTLPGATMEPLEFKLKESVASDGSTVRALAGNPILRIAGETLPAIQVGSIVRFQVAIGSLDDTLIILNTECRVMGAHSEDVFDPFGSPVKVQLGTIHWSLEVRVQQIKMA